MTSPRTDPISPQASPTVTARVFEGFDDPTVTADEWNALVHRGDTDAIYLTWHWLRAWWRTLGSGQLLLTAMERDGRLVAIAPFYVDSGMVFFVGSGTSDNMDFIGDVSDPEVLDALLVTARAEATGFVGFRLYGVLDTSRTSARVQAAAKRLGLQCYEEQRWSAPVIDLGADPDGVRLSAGERRIAKREQYFRRQGELTLRQFTDNASIVPHLEAFFEQHISRQAVSDDESQFVDRRRRAFLEQLTRTAADTGWLRLSILDWDGRPIAFEYGLSYERTYYSGPTSFAVDLVRRAPDQVLLRQLLLAALDNGVETYDLGVGDDSFKFTFATHLRHVHTWGLYPREPLPALS